MTKNLTLKEKIQIYIKNRKTGGVGVYIVMRGEK